MKTNSHQGRSETFPFCEKRLMHFADAEVPKEMIDFMTLANDFFDRLGKGEVKEEDMKKFKEAVEAILQSHGVDAENIKLLQSGITLLGETMRDATTQWKTEMAVLRSIEHFFAQLKNDRIKVPDELKDRLIVLINEHDVVNPERVSPSDWVVPLAAEPPTEPTRTEEEKKADAGVMAAPSALLTDTAKNTEARESTQSLEDQILAARELAAEFAKKQKEIWRTYRRGSQRINSPTARTAAIGSEIQALRDQMGHPETVLAELRREYIRQHGGGEAGLAAYNTFIKSTGLMLSGSRGLKSLEAWRRQNNALQEEGRKMDAKYRARSWRGVANSFMKVIRPEDALITTGREPSPFYKNASIYIPGKKEILYYINNPSGDNLPGLEPHPETVFYGSGGAYRGELDPPSKAEQARVQVEKTFSGEITTIVSALSAPPMGIPREIILRRSDGRGLDIGTKLRISLVLDMKVDSSGVPRPLYRVFNDFVEKSEGRAERTVQEFENRGDAITQIRELFSRVAKEGKDWMEQVDKIPWSPQWKRLAGMPVAEDVPISSDRRARFEQQVYKVLFPALAKHHWIKENDLMAGLTKDGMTVELYSPKKDKPSLYFDWDHTTNIIGTVYKVRPDLKPLEEAERVTGYSGEKLDSALLIELFGEVYFDIRKDPAREARGKPPDTSTENPLDLDIPETRRKGFDAALTSLHEYSKSKYEGSDKEKFDRSGKELQRWIGSFAQDEWNIILGEYKDIYTKSRGLGFENNPEVFRSAEGDDVFQFPNGLTIFVKKSADATTVRIVHPGDARTAPLEPEPIPVEKEVQIPKTVEAWNVALGAMYEEVDAMNLNTEGWSHDWVQEFLGCCSVKVTAVNSEKEQGIFLAISDSNIAQSLKRDLGDDFGIAAETTYPVMAEPFHKLLRGRLEFLKVVNQEQKEATRVQKILEEMKTRGAPWKDLHFSVRSNFASHRGDPEGVNTWHHEIFVDHSVFGGVKDVPYFGIMVHVLSDKTARLRIWSSFITDNVFEARYQTFEVALAQIPRLIAERYYHPVEAREEELSQEDLVTKIRGIDAGKYTFDTSDKSRGGKAFWVEMKSGKRERVVVCFLWEKIGESEKYYGRIAQVVHIDASGNSHDVTNDVTRDVKKSVLQQFQEILKQIEEGEVKGIDEVKALEEKKNEIATYKFTNNLGELKAKLKDEKHVDLHINYDNPLAMRDLGDLINKDADFRKNFVEKVRILRVASIGIGPVLQDAFDRRLSPEHVYLEGNFRFNINDSILRIRYAMEFATAKLRLKSCEWTGTLHVNMPKELQDFYLPIKDFPMPYSIRNSDGSINIPAGTIPKD